MERLAKAPRPGSRSVGRLRHADGQVLLFDGACDGARSIHAAARLPFSRASRCMPRLETRVGCTARRPIARHMPSSAPPGQTSPFPTPTPPPPHARHRRCSAHAGLAGSPKVSASWSATACPRSPSDRACIPLLPRLRQQLPPDFPYADRDCASKRAWPWRRNAAKDLGARLSSMLIVETPGPSVRPTPGVYITHRRAAGGTTPNAIASRNIRPEGLGYAAARSRLRGWCGIACDAGLPASSDRRKPLTASTDKPFRRHSATPMMKTRSRP